VFRLLSLLPVKDHDEATATEYNRLTQIEYEQIRDFLILHYHATERDDSPLWDYCRTMAIPDSLRHKIDLFRSRARIARFDDQLFAEPSWLAVFLGQGIQAQDYDRLADAPALSDVAGKLAGVRAGIHHLASRLPTHEQFIAATCRAERAEEMAK
jgi:tryptophan halogenase